MSDWTGKNNPGHKRRVQRWREIEAEFMEPVADVIQGLREQGNSWRTVAGALGCAQSTLKEWRRALGLPLDQNDKVRDPSSTPERTPTDLAARELGYEDAEDAVLDMRLREQMTIFQAAERLGVHYCTVVLYTPKKLRGTIYNRSERWWQVRRAQARAMTERNREVYAQEHIWRSMNTVRILKIVRRQGKQAAAEWLEEHGK